MAEWLATIDGHLGREFCFVQELVWSDPHRNPFPRCTDKILAGLKNLRQLFQRIPVELDRSRKLRQLATRLATVVEKDAVAIVDYRRSYVNEASSAVFTLPRADVERTVDNIIVQHLDNTWMDTEDNAHASGVSTLLEARAINWKQLHRGITTFLETVIKPGSSFSFVSKESLSAVSDSIRLPPRQAAAGNHQPEGSCLSDALKDDKWQNDGVVQGAGHEQPSMDATSCDESRTGAEMSSSGADQQGEEGVEIDPSAPNHLSSLNVYPSVVSTTRELHEILEERRAPSPSVAMTMKAGLREAHDGEPWWHIMLALENKSSSELAVDVLSFWSLLKDGQPTTIRWPKGDIVLRAKDSFVCYSIRWPCHGALCNSPEIGFSWSYSIISSTSTVGETTTGAPQSTAQGDSKRWLGKRVASVLSWLGRRKRQKTQASQYDD